MASKPPDTALHIALTEAPDAAQGVSLMQRAQGIIIRDKASHEACREFLKGAKALKRSIEDHYAAIKKPLNEARNTVLDMEKRHLAPVLQAIATAEKFDTEYVREQRRIEEETARLERERLEREEQARREKEAAKAEAEALKLEASSNVLSAREQKVIARLMAGSAVDRTSLRGWFNAAVYAEYKNPTEMAPRLMQSVKLNEALDAAIKADRIRRESEAKQAAPILVDVPKVESQIGSVAGTSLRKYYSCDPQVDLRALVGAWLDGRVPANAIQPNMVALNDAARSLKELFPKAYPGCAVSVKEGIAG